MNFYLNHIRYNSSFFNPSARGRGTKALTATLPSTNLTRDAIMAPTLSDVEADADFDFKWECCAEVDCSTSKTELGTTRTHTIEADD